MPPKNQTKKEDDAAQQPEDDAAQQPEDPRARVVFKDGIPDEIDGFRFASIVHDDTRYHVSEPMPLDKVERLVGIPGFASCPLPEEVCQPLFDAALASRDTAMQKSGLVAASKSTREAELEQQIVELQNANTGLAADVRAANERCKTLEEAGLKVAKQLSAARAAGFVPKE